METKTIGGKIAKARKEINMSQAQLAKLLFISPQAVGKWERGESVPDILTFSRLAEVLGVNLNYFSEQPRPESHENAPGHSGTAGIEQAANEMPNTAPTQKREVRINLTAANLEKSDFAGVTLHKGKFKTSPLQGADFTGADLTGTLFDVCDARDARFDAANLTDCAFLITELAGAGFNKATLVCTDFNKSGLAGTKFTDVELVDAKLTMTDLRKTIFENCVFNGVDFKYTDMRGMHFEGQTFINVHFEKSALSNVSFTGATLRNVSFRLPFSVTNKSYRDFKTVCFDGAMMDKLTYAGLKGLSVVDLSKVIII